MKNPTPKIEPASFIIKDHSDITKVINFLHNNYLKVDKSLVVHISQKQEDRSKAQNRLYWKWLTQWAKHQGTDKEYEHCNFKRTFLSRIYMRDDVGEYRKTFETIIVLRDQNHPLYAQIRDGMVGLMSTTDANVEQFTEYLNDIHAYCLSKGCYLHTPDDLMYAWEMKQ